jgi:glycine betaine/proline transport system permease protein
VRNFSVVLACLIGIPIGMYTASSKRLWAWVEAAIDTLQTLPSFVYLMPAVMLFRVGDFTAMLAVVAYAVSPVIRYTALACNACRQPDRGGAGQWLHRLAADDQDPAETGAARDHARHQPDVMLALSMLVITALVGTRTWGRRSTLR